jgi:hypothetical protein
MEISVYHASNINYIKEFDISKLRMGDYGPGFYFAEDEESTSSYGQYVYKAKIFLDNPLDIENASEKEVSKLMRIFRISDYDIFDDEGPPLAQVFGLIQAAWQIGSYKIDKVIYVLKRLGYDGIVVPNKGFWVVFDNNQIELDSWRVRK